MEPLGGELTVGGTALAREEALGCAAWGVGTSGLAHRLHNSCFPGAFGLAT
jgi:hypothetical protein